MNKYHSIEVLDGNIIKILFEIGGGYTYALLYNINEDTLETANGEQLCVGLDDTLTFISDVVDDKSYLEIERTFYKTQ